MSATSFENVRIADVRAFVIAAKKGSVTGAARELRTTPSHISKAIGRVETAAGCTLLSRSSRGVSLLDRGQRLMPGLEQLVRQAQNLDREDIDETKPLSVAAPSFMLMHLLPRIVAATPSIRFRALELPPAVLRGCLSLNLFSVAFSLGQIGTLPPSWASTRLGSVRRGLFASPTVAAELGTAPIPTDNLLTAPFVIPVCLADGRFVPADDDCPLPRSERRAGHDASTIGVALALAASADQIVYGPVMAAKPFLERGDLVEIVVEGWDDKDEMWVVYNKDNTLARDLQHIVSAAKAALAELE